MRRCGLAVVAGCTALLGAGSMTRADNAPPLVPEATIALPNTSGRIDHLAINLARKHLFIAELGNGSVDVVDLGANRVLHRITGLKEPQGVVYAESSDRIAVASAGDGTVRLFAADTFVPVGVIALGDDADNTRLRTDSKDIVVGFGKGGLAVIDPERGVARAKIPLAAHPEGFQLTSDGHAYVNVPNAGAIEVVDLSAARTIAKWSLPGLSGNFPMALGEPGIVGVVFRSPARFARIDQSTGREISQSNTCGDADDVFFDAKRQRYYISCGAGAVDVFQVAGNEVRALAPVATSGGARTSLFVPELDRLFVAVRAGLLGSDASIRVMRPAP
jgi:DNA-binding beta-propeller fold protein YncE